MAEPLDPFPAKPRKLPGRMRRLRLSAGTASGSALWLAPHSLILSQLHFYRESYRHFDFKSIQGIVLRQTSRGMVYTTIGALLALGFGVLTVEMLDDVYSRWTDGSITAFWLLLTLVNIARGPTCRVELQTAVGRRELVTLNRTRPALRAIGMIAEAVEREQGALSPEDATARMNAFLDPHPAAA